MPMNTGYLGSGQTTDFPSNVSIRQALTVHGVLNSASAGSFGAITGTTGTFSSQVSATGNVRGLQIVGSDGSAIGPSFTFASDMSRGFYRSAASTIAITSGVTFDWRTGSVKWSWVTNANTSGMTTGEIRIVHAASGFSLMFSSGATTYTLGASAVSAAQA